MKKLAYFSLLFCITNLSAQEEYDHKKTIAAFIARPKRKYNHPKTMLPCPSFCPQYMGAAFKILVDGEESQTLQEPCNNVFINPYALRCFVKKHVFKDGSLNGAKIPSLDQKNHNDFNKLCTYFYGTTYPIHTRQKLDSIIQKLQECYSYHDLLDQSKCIFKNLNFVEQLQFIWKMAQEEERLRIICEHMFLNNMVTLIGHLARCNISKAFNVQFYSTEEGRYAVWRMVTQHFMQELQKIKQ